MDIYLVDEKIALVPSTTNPPTDILTVEAFYNGIDGVIQLNVTFPVQGERFLATKHLPILNFLFSVNSTTDDFIHFHIAAHHNGKTNSCDSNYVYETAISMGHVKSKTTSVLLPTQPASKSEELQGGCAYEIRVKDSDSFVYTVPGKKTSILNVPSCFSFNF